MRAAVLGSPISHSLSPILHRAAYEWLGLDWTYEAIECAERDLPAFVAALDQDWAGLSLTMPLKVAILPLLDEVSDVARLVGAANTVVLADGRLIGSNTDAPGLAAALSEAGVVAESATVLGAGATARSALAGLAELGVRAVAVYGRKPVALTAMAELGGSLGLAIETFDWSRAVHGLSRPLVISTVPAGAADELAGAVPMQRGTLFDVLYAPWPTPLAQGWGAGGGRVLGGLDLLVHQGVLQVRAMTHCTESAADLVPVLRSAGSAALNLR